MRTAFLVSALALVPCLAPSPVAAEPPRPGKRWRVETAIPSDREAPRKFNGVVVADLDPDRPGLEIAAVASSGAVVLAWREGPAWKHAEIARAHGELIQVAAGDVDPRSPGLELLVGGKLRGQEHEEGQGAAYVLRREGKAWLLETAFVDAALVHAVCVHDVDPDRAGEEGVVSGFSRALTVLTREADAWKPRTIATLPSPAKHVAPHGKGVVVACGGGELVEAYARPGEGRSEVLFSGAAGLARLASDGQRIVIARDDGAFVLRSGTQVFELHQEAQKLRGAVWAELDARSPGLECATAGYEGRVSVFHASETGWEAEVAVEGAPGAHHLASGDLRPDLPGDELVLAGLDGTVRVVSRR